MAEILRQRLRRVMSAHQQNQFCRDKCTILTQSKPHSYLNGLSINVGGLGLAEEVVHWPRTAPIGHCELVSVVRNVMMSDHCKSIQDCR